MAEKSYSIFSVSDEITVSRFGKNVLIKGRDGTTNQSDSVESNLLFEILKAVKKSK